MSFHITPQVHVDLDPDGNVQSIEHLQQPFPPVSSGAAPDDPVLTCQDYLSATAPIYGIPQSYLEGLQSSVAARPALTDEPAKLQLAGNPRPRHRSVIVSFQLTVLGLPVWEAGVSITLDEDRRVVNSTSTVKAVVPAVEKPGDGTDLLGDISEEVLVKALGLPSTGQEISINTQRLLVHRYIAEARQQSEDELGDSVPAVNLPPVADSIKPNDYYVVREVLFTWNLPEYGTINWRTFIELKTGNILYLRAFLAAAFGYVYTRDPITRGIANSPAVTAPAAELDAIREWKELPDILSSSPQALQGQYVRITDLDKPDNDPPTSLTGDFDFSVPSDGFAAVSAYYQIATMFQLLVTLGFNVKDLFPSLDRAGTGIAVPLPVDSRGSKGRVNANSLGNADGTGTGGITFGIAAANTTIGMAVDFRVAAHEFCHALLWEAVHSPGFGFAHSAGDSLAAIHCDPGSLAGDRFDTFPWSVPIRRRHDRDVAAGWAWGGSEDRGGYNSEQILSTTLFRAYRAIGGDSDTVQKQERASKYMLYLIVAGIASLGASAITPTLSPIPYVNAMMLADGGFILGRAGGAIRKVIRWSFEKQGLYQLPNTPRPFTFRGAPPAVDVYVDDGRAGEYDYTATFDQTTDIWNRRVPDSGTTHEAPVIGQTNFCYAHIRNRGTQIAQNVVVTGYHLQSGAEILTWPDSFEPMSTASMVAPDIPSRGETVAGPFEWLPRPTDSTDALLISASTLGDVSNIDAASGLDCARGPIDIGDLVPYDNNIALRKVQL